MDYSENFFKSVEHRNAEFNSLLYGTDYLKGLQINNLMRVVTKLDFKLLADAVRLKIADKMLNKYQKKRKFQSEPSGISTYESYQKLKKKRIVIYTCILGGYDTLKEPLLEFDNVTYICYTDDAVKIKNDDDTKWIIQQIPEGISKRFSKIMTNRYLKMHPKELFPDADYAIYVDGNIGIQSFLGAYLVKTDVSTGIAIFSHSQRQCVYAEALACISRKKGNRKAIEYQIELYKKEGFPKNFGLYECTIIASDLQNTTSVDVLDKWWKAFLYSKSFRDQLSLPYVMWKIGRKYTDIGLLGDNIFDDGRITVYGH